MTEEQIIKALEERIKALKDDYKRLQALDAPMDCFEESHIDNIRVLSNALDLINRQKKELAETQAKLEALLCETTGGKLSKHTYTAEVMTTQAHEHLLKCCDDERAEAVKEFEERAIKKICEKVYAPTPVQSCIVEKCNQVIVETAKEMVGENND